MIGPLDYLFAETFAGMCYGPAWWLILFLAGVAVGLGVRRQAP